MRKKNKQNLFVLNITAFASVAKKWPITKRILVIGSKCVIKQS